MKSAKVNKALLHQNLLLTLIAFIMSYLSLQTAEAMRVSQELDKNFEQADAVIEARVLSAESIEWSFQDKSGYCGFIFKVRIISSFSGGLVDEIEIGAQYPLVPGGTYLLFIKDMPSVLARSDFFMEQTQPIQEKIDECEAKLPLLKSKYWLTAEIAGHYKKFAFFSGLQIPEDLQKIPSIIDCKLYINNTDWEELSEETNLTAEEEVWYQSLMGWRDAYYSRSVPPCHQTKMVQWEELSERLRELGESQAEDALSEPDAQR